MEILVGLAGSTNRLVEIVKRYLERYAMDESARRLLLLLAQLVIGVVSVFLAASQMDVLAGTPFARIPGVYGLFVAGLSVGAGAEFLHLIFDVTGRLGTPTASATISLPDTSTDSTPPSATATVSVNTDSSIARG